MNILSSEILVELQNLLSASRVHHDELTLGVYARDTSLYHIVSQVVIEVENECEMSKVLVLAYANLKNIKPMPCVHVRKAEVPAIGGKSPKRLPNRPYFFHQEVAPRFSPTDWHE